MKDFACTFCGAARTTVKKLVPGPLVFICNACVVQARTLIGSLGEAPTQRLGSVSFYPSLVDADARLAPPLRANQDACSFCGIDGSSATAVLVGQVAKICDRCLFIAEDIIAKS
jgi:hypothetical protein